MDKSKTLIWVMSLAFIFTIISCTKEGPIGPEGKTGANGINGTNGTNGTSLTLRTDSFNVASASWVLGTPNYYSVNLSDSSITTDIVNRGNIEAFLFNPINSEWYALDDVVAGGSGYRYAFKVGVLTLFADNFTSVPAKSLFKIILISGY